MKSCPNCKSERISGHSQFGSNPHLKHKIMAGVYLDVAVLTHYDVCNYCGLIFQNPSMSGAEIENFYSKGYYRKTINLTAREVDIDEKARAEFDSKIIRKHTKGKVASHLDIGCSRGFLLEEVNAKLKTGVELDTKYVKKKDIKVYSKIEFVPSDQYDLITAIHVLEHVPDPRKQLQSMVSLLSKDGYLVIEVPTWKSPGGPLRLAHLFHFEPSVLRLMCIQMGLEIVHEEFTPHLLLICRPDGTKLSSHAR